MLAIVSPTYTFIPPRLNVKSKACPQSDLHSSFWVLHRGRLNVLCNIMRKPAGALYGEMEGGQSEFHVGDVKYHMGQSASLHFDNHVRRPAPLVTLVWHS